MPPPATRPAHDEARTPFGAPCGSTGPESTAELSARGKSIMGRDSQSPLSLPKRPALTLAHAGAFVGVVAGLDRCWSSVRVHLDRAWTVAGQSDVAPGPCTLHPAPCTLHRHHRVALDAAPGQAETAESKPCTLHWNRLR
jgi:hypothetical protein